MRRGIVLSVVLTVGLAVGCGGGGDDSSARLEVDGRALVARGEAPFEAVDDDHTLGPGDRLRVEDGTAVIVLDEQRKVELRRGSEVELQDGRAGGTDLHTTLTAGDLLVSAPSDPLVVTAGATDVSVTGGSARLSRGPAIVVASYSGRARATSAGQSIEVPALRQVSIPAAGPLPTRPTPLDYQASDPWDLRLLGDAIELGDQLAARSRGFTAQVGTGMGRTPGFYRLILPALETEPTFDTTLLGPNRDPGEALVGLAITLEGTRGSFAERVRAVLAFHDEGAAWGLVALDQGVARAPLLAAIDAAIGRGPSSVAEGGPPPVRAPAPTTPARRPASVPPRGPRGTIVSPPPTVAPPVDSAPSGNPGPARTGVPAIDNTVNSLVDLLGGLLGGL